MGEPCGNFELDLVGKTFGACKHCGYKKGEHKNTETSLLGARRPPPSVFHQNKDSNTKRKDQAPPLVTKRPDIAPAKKDKVVYKALYDFKSTRQGDLDLVAGELVYDVEREPGGGWMKGRIGNKLGRFPSDYVENLEQSNGSTTTKEPTTSERRSSVKELQARLMEKPEAAHVPMPEAKNTAKHEHVRFANPEGSKPVEAPVLAGRSTERRSSVKELQARLEQTEKPKPVETPIPSTSVKEIQARLAQTEKPKPKIVQSPPEAAPTTTDKPRRSSVKELQEKLAMNTLNSHVTKTKIDMGQKDSGSVRDLQAKIATSLPFGKPKQNQVKILYTYADPDTGLSFHEGELVSVLEKLSDDWVICEKQDGKKGPCPSSYLESEADLEKSKTPPHQPSHSHSHSDTERFARAEYDFPPQQDGDLEFSEGDIIQIVEEIDEDWWKGKVVEGSNVSDQLGLFPKTFVKIVEKPGTSTHHHPPPPPSVQQEHHPPQPHNPLPPSPPPMMQQQQSREMNAPAWQAPPPPPPILKPNDDPPFPSNMFSSKNETAPPPPPPPARTQSNAGPALQPGRTTTQISRTFSTSGGGEPPPSPWYEKGDTYSCRISIAGPKKTETFDIKKQDRSQIKLQIVQNSGDPLATVTAEVHPFEPLSAQELQLVAQANGPRIVRYAESKEGSFDGNGECWTLADNALKHIGTVEHAVGKNFGQKIPIEQVMPGDIIQFESCKFIFPGGSKTAGAPDHTAIVQKRITPTSVQVWEQNPNPVSKGHYDFSQLVSGSYECYRPVPKDRSTIAPPPPPPPPSISTSPIKRAICRYDFPAQQPGDLTISVGDRIVITSQDGEWSTGYVEGRPEVSGTFPTSFVEIL